VIEMSATTASAALGGGLPAAQAAALTADDVLARLGSGPHGLAETEAARRLADGGPNAVRSHQARAWPLLWRQLRSPLFLLLAITAIASGFVGERSDAVIISLILAASAGLGFVNEYRAERAAQALHDEVRHRCVVTRDGAARSIDVTELVPGDVLDLAMGQLVPADCRVIDANGLECEESVLTGESLPVEKGVALVAADTVLAERSSMALMGTVVHAGSGRAVVVATAGAAEFGRIALELGEADPPTAFQRGLERFSLLLVQVAGTLTIGIFLVNVALHRPLIDAVLFSLAIAVGISPQLLPAVVSTSLAAGARRLSKRKVLVKRLVCIEDLGDIDVLFTDKTGTLTDGRIRFMRSVDASAAPSDDPMLLGLVCTEAELDDAGRPVGGNPLDLALWQSPRAERLRGPALAHRRVATLPFDHNRRLVSVLVDRPDGGARVLITKGAPEAVFADCTQIPSQARQAIDAEFAAGNRVVAVASRPADRLTTLVGSDEAGLQLAGFVVFLDPPKPDARQALDRLASLGITVKVVTGDNPVVAARVCTDLGLTPGRVITGTDIDAADDAALAALIPATTVFARVSPEHKARIVRIERAAGGDVAFLGDGVNDALALHAADVGISVDSATDAAKDAADVILLEKDLDVLADGVVGGRRIFANTIKYVLMGTSSNFGNMVSAAGASAFLSFLPMLPSQILLNNLLYDSSQLAIPTDRVDAEQLARPSHWDVAFIRRFMLFFGPVSSVFDALTFVVMLKVFHAGPALFRSGWFVESLATQTLIIFAIRTRRVPFVRSRPSMPLLLSVLGVVAVGMLLPGTPLAGTLGFQALPGPFFAVLVAMIGAYLLLIEVAKRWFFRTPAEVGGRRPPRSRASRVRRRASRFSTR
jgi:Mg2+-importing ATPase